MGQRLEKYRLQHEKIPEKIDIFSLKGTKFIGKTIDVYDGDTFTVRVFFYGKLTNFRIRLDRFDAYELRPKKKNFENEEKRQEHIKLGVLAKTALTEKILGKIVRLECNGFDVFGRVLADVYLDKVNIREWMILNGYGVEYDGKTKTL